MLPTGRQPISIPARIGLKRTQIAKGPPSAPSALTPQQQPSSSPATPVSSEGKLDFTVPQDTAASGREAASREHTQQVMYIREEQITFSEMPGTGGEPQYIAAGSYGCDDLEGWHAADRQIHMQTDESRPRTCDPDTSWSPGLDEFSGRGRKQDEQGSVLSSLQEEPQEELEAALQKARDEDMGCFNAKPELDFVPDTVAKCSPQMQSSSLCKGISPAGRLGFQQRGMCSAAEEDAEGQFGPGRQEVFLERLRSPQLDSVVASDSATELGLLDCQDAAELRSTNDEALGLACTLREPTGAGSQQLQSLWAAFYEGPDILLEAERGFQQHADPAQLPGSFRDDAMQPAMQLDDLLSPIHRHPLALGARQAGPSVPGLSRRAGGAKRAKQEPGSPARKLMRACQENSASSGALQLPTSPTVEAAGQLSPDGSAEPLLIGHLGSHRNASAAGAASVQLDSLHGQLGRRGGQLGSPGRQRRRVGGGGSSSISVLQELSNEANQQEADLERLLTPQQAGKSIGEGEAAVKA